MSIGRDRVALCAGGRTLPTLAKMHRRAILSMALAVFLTLGASTTRADTAQDVQHFIQDLAQKAITTVAAGNISDAERRQNFRRLFVSAFDIPGIGKFVLARYWRTATPAQQKKFLKEFEDMQVLVWSLRFKGYHGETLETLGATKGQSGEWQVNSRILRPNAPPLSVQWRVHQADDGTLRIVDIIPENASMALTQREEFAETLQQNGGNVEALLSRMRARNGQLAETP